MSFDFPGSPSLGDVFTDPSGASYNWNGYAWMGGAANSMGALIVSPTPPPAPTDNSLWWESDSGMLFLRYNDGNSSQWVQVNALPNGAGYMPLQGVTDGSNAPAGQIGEVISANVTTPVTLTTMISANLTSITLTAGDWDICGEIWYAGTASPIVIEACLNTISATVPSVSALNTARTRLPVSSGFTASGVPIITTKVARASFSASQTYFLVAFANFPSGTCTVTGNIIARRAR